MAIAGPYANRLALVAALISFGACAGRRHELPVCASVAPQPLAPGRDDDREHAAGDRREEERGQHQRGPDDGADRGHQLHVPGSRGAERVARHHQQEPETKSHDRAGTEMPLAPAAARPMPRLAMAAVRSFGIRRDLDRSPSPPPVPRRALRAPR